MKKIILTGSVILTFVLGGYFSLSAQSEIVPLNIRWIVDGKPVTLKKAYNEGIEKCENLTIEVFFSNSLLKKYAKEQLKFEFKWFHYYSTTKEFMDSYSINYNDNNTAAENSFILKSSRANISKGWWEVQIISKIDGKTVTFDNIQRFQAYVH